MNTDLPDTLEFIDITPFQFNPTFYITIVSIFIALLALILPVIRSFYKERKRLNSIETYTYFILESLSDPIKKKLENLSELSESIKYIETRNFAFAETSNLLTEAFTKILHQDLHSIFITKKKGKLQEKIIHFKNIVDTVNFFEKQNMIDQKNFYQYMNDLRRYEKDYAVNTDSILRLFDLYTSIIRRENIPPSKDPFFKNFDVILYNWHKDPNYSLITKTKEMMLNPLKELCKKYQEDPRAMEVLPFIIKCNAAYLDLENLHILYHNIFKEVTKKLSDWNNALSSALKYYKKQA